MHFSIITPASGVCVCVCVCAVIVIVFVIVYYCRYYSCLFCFVLDVLLLRPIFFICM